MNKANNVISLIDIKKALRDSVFRDSLPQDLKEDIKKFLENPSCACNVPIYHKVMKYGGEALRNYYPDKNLVSPEEEAVQLARNNWSVFNCSIGELELKLKNLRPGRKQIAISRFEDQVTVIINELDILY